MTLAAVPEAFSGGLKVIVPFHPAVQTGDPVPVTPDSATAGPAGANKSAPTGTTAATIVMAGLLSLMMPPRA